MIMEGLIEGRKHTYNISTAKFESHALAMKMKSIRIRA